MTEDLTGRRVRLTVGLFDGTEGLIVSEFIARDGLGRTREWRVQDDAGEFSSPLPFNEDEFEVIP